MRNHIRRLVVDDSGQDIVEYALLVALVVLVSIAGWNAIFSAIDLAYDRHDSSLWDLYWKAPGT